MPPFVVGQSPVKRTAWTLVVVVASYLLHGCGGGGAATSTATPTATHLAITGAAMNATAGMPFTFTVSALDASNAVVAGYAGTVQITTSDAKAALPANMALTQGIGAFALTFNTGGSQTITASDAAGTLAPVTSAAISVNGGAAVSLRVSAPVSAFAGAPYPLTVVALDSSNNTATSYSGTVHFTSSDASAVLPADTVLTQGTVTRQVTLNASGIQTVTAADTANPALSGSGSVSVGTGPATSLVLTVPSSSRPGKLFGFTVTAMDAMGSPATAYAGTVHFTSSDPAAVLPADAPLNAGTRNFPATLKTAGSWTITATDRATASVTGTSKSVVVSAGPAPNAHPFVNQPLRPGAAAPGGVGFTLIVAGSGFVAGSVVNWNGSARATTFLSAGKLSASIPATDIAAATTASVTVTSPAPGGGTSNRVFFDVGTSSTSIGFGMPAPVATHSRSVGMATGDFNGDGNQDLAVANLGSNDVGVLLGQGDGTFKSAVNYAAGNSPAAVTVGDFNGDGNLDLVVANSGGNNISVLLGNGGGTFQPAVAYGAGSQPQAVAMGDFNDDGNLDLVVANYGSGTVSVLLGNGDGTFEAALDYAAGPGPYSVAVGDFDGDGALDLAVANQQGTTVSVLLGNGDGTFRPAVTYAVGTSPVSISVADLNGDGNLDLVVANSGTASVSVLLGRGDGTFQPATDYDAGSVPVSVAVADFNDDGKLDLVVADFVGSGLMVLLGNGDGTFQSAAHCGPPGGPGSYVAVGDFDRDGRLDLAVANADQTGGISILAQETTTQVSAPSVDFTTQLLAVPSAAQVLTLTNAGGLPLQIASVSLSGANAGDFSTTQTCGAVLAAAASCAISVTFTPTQVGPRAAALVIVDDSPTSPQSIGLTGVGLTTGSNATLLPSSLTFAPQVIGAQSAYQTVTLGNYGTSSLTVTNIAATANFADSQSCPTTLASGTTCPITVRFAPQSAGSLTGTLSVADDASGSPQTVALSGIGAEVGTVTLGPSSMFFVCHSGVGPPPGCSSPATATLRNTGATPVYLLSIVLSGKGFAESNTCPSTLQPGQSCAITVSFDGVPGRRQCGACSATSTGAVTVYDTASGSPQSIALTGVSNYN